MIRRSPIETKINHERWLVSYADFITLLFAFFVVMYSVSHVNESKYRTLSASLQSVFNPKTAGQDYTQEGQATFELGSLENIFAEFDGSASEFIESSGIKTRGNEQWVEIELDANLLFVSGSAELNPAASDILAAVSLSLLEYENAVSVEGHTDNIPIATARFENNWQLSAARAVSVVNFLVFQGLDPRLLSAVGFGEYRPIADNSTEEGRRRNRRVTIRVANHSVPDTELEPPPLLVNGQDPNDNVGAAQNFNEAVKEPNTLPKNLKPVRLEGGGILFSSDPNLPRTNAPVEAQPSPER